ncbi:hypothetical protein [Haloarcula halophila]|uniref:hypothetical protein n=1 Tax=Haloarcula TaxID=2237 RepID=UPI0023E3919F|nr:hypothetical protein [Halomicroarcula sp. DFY41]
MQRSQTPDRVEREKIEGIQTKISIYHRDPEYAVRIEVDRLDRWEFGIDDDGVATLLSTSLGSREVPDWLDESLAGMGIEVDV